MKLNVFAVFLIGLSMSVAQQSPTKTRRGPPPARFANAPPSEVWGPPPANGGPVPSATNPGGYLPPSPVQGQTSWVNNPPARVVYSSLPPAGTNSPVVRGPPPPRHGADPENFEPVAPASRTKSLGFLGGPDPYVPPILPPTTMPPLPAPTVRYDVPDVKKEEEEES
ncbi:uncharacterized protein LOC127856559 [Dreissena polymorpha]|uniref:Uncharacterized protein n=1 Tax=Dreissena polymorpha TaxID=45954 RepID=A0A9D4HHZ3_DREPO|nr:uncharacterized protein LOC127856559 [Dreissena polymorpha]KAH3719825.1 hypothetical protein DPMN_062709 [Dreissena polymorpha]